MDNLIKLTKVCNRCSTEKTVDNFSPAAIYKGKQLYRGECKECNRALQKLPSAKRAQKKYKTSIRAYEVRSISRNLPEVRAKENLQEKNRYHTNPKNKARKIRNSIRNINNRLANDPVYRTIFYLKNRLRDWVKASGSRKNSEIGNYVGCTKEEFRLHIEKQFKPGMTWENHGEWEIDHIVPIASATTMEEAYKLTHYTNIQPLWKDENRRKSDKLNWQVNY